MTKLSIFSLSFFVIGSIAASPLIGMPNPASQYCIDQGGYLVMTQTAHGNINICHLPNANAIEEWHLYRQDHNQSLYEKDNKVSIEPSSNE